MDIQYRHNSTGEMYPRHRFELHYDQGSYRPNRPVNARLHQFAHTGSMPSSPQARTMFPRAAAPPLATNSHQELTQLSYGGGPPSAIDTAPGHSPRQSPHASVSMHRELSRSVSMPVLQDQHNYTSTREGRVAQRHSRKNSLVSNCTHSSREASVSSEMSMASDDGERPDRSNCHRHHHRRGSVAIKFEEKKVVEDWNPAAEHQKEHHAHEDLHFNEGVFEY